MTTKEEILKEFDEYYGAGPRYLNPQNPDRFTAPPSDLRKWLSKVLDRYALAVVEASLPKEKPEPLHSLRDTSSYDRACGWNNCRDEVKLNALRIVGGGEESEKG